MLVSSEPPRGRWRYYLLVSSGPPRGHERNYSLFSSTKPPNTQYIGYLGCSDVLRSRLTVWFCTFRPRKPIHAHHVSQHAGGERSSLLPQTPHYSPKPLITPPSPSSLPQTSPYSPSPSSLPLTSQYSPSPLLLLLPPRYSSSHLVTPPPTSLLPLPPHYSSAAISRCLSPQRGVRSREDGQHKESHPVLCHRRCHGRHREKRSTYFAPPLTPPPSP